MAFGPFFHSIFWTPRVILLLGALPFGLYELARLVRHRDRTALAGAAIIGWALFVGLISDAPIASIVMAIGRWDSVLWLSSALGLWALGRRLSARGRVALMVAFLGACVASGVIGVFQATFDITYEPLATAGRRASGFGVNPVYFGATMAGAAGCCIREYVTGQSPSARSLGIVGRRSRSVSGDAVRITCRARVVRPTCRRRTHPRSVPPFHDPGSDGCGAALVATLLQRSGGSADSSAADRLTVGGIWPRVRVWSYGWRAFLDRPITGYGLGRYRPATQRFYSPEFARREASDDLIQTWFDPHNVVVQVAVSLGVVGLVLFAWFLVSAARRSRGPLLWAASGSRSVGCSNHRRT